MVEGAFSLLLQHGPFAGLAVLFAVLWWRALMRYDALAREYREHVESDLAFYRNVDKVVNGAAAQDS